MECVIAASGIQEGITINCIYHVLLKKIPWVLVSHSNRIRNEDVLSFQIIQFSTCQSKTKVGR